MTRPIRARGLLTALGVVGVVAALAPTASARASVGFAFTDLGSPPGAGEPNIALDPRQPGRVVVSETGSAEVDEDGKVYTGSPFWVSRTGGRSFTGPVVRGAAGGGFDIDTAFSSSGHLLLADLQDSGGQLGVCIDNEAGFESPHHLPCGAEPLPGAQAADRPWLTTTPGHSFLVWHDFVTGALRGISSTDDFATTTQCGLAPSVTDAHFTDLTGLNTQVAKPVADSAGRLVMAYATEIAGQLPDVGDRGTLRAAVSSDNCTTFKVSTVYSDPGARISNGTFPVLAAGPDGTLYLVVTARLKAGADRHVYLFSSRDHGTTWSSPKQISASSDGSAIYPSLAAGNDGQIAVGWYSTKSGTPTDTSKWRYSLALSSDRGRNLTRYDSGAGVVVHGALAAREVGDMTSMVFDPSTDRVLVTFGRPVPGPDGTRTDLLVARQIAGWPKH